LFHHISPSFDFAAQANLTIEFIMAFLCAVFNENCQIGFFGSQTYVPVDISSYSVFGLIFWDMRRYCKDIRNCLIDVRNGTKLAG